MYSFAESGMKPKTLQTILGYSNIGITMNLYVHTTEEQKQKEINQIADAAKKLAEEYGRKVTAEELAAETKFSQKIIEEAYRVSGDKIEDLEKTHE